MGSDIGVRKILHEGFSEISGGFVVEEIRVDDQIFRRLVFLNNQAIVQSEALMRTSRIKNKAQMVVDYGYLACQHHLLMIIGILTSFRIVNEKDSLIIGLGGGGLCNYINHYIKYAVH